MNGNTTHNNTEVDHVENGPVQYDFLTLKVGSVVAIEGVALKLVNMNYGKRRLTFVPVSAKQKLPVEQMKNPTIAVKT